MFLTEKEILIPAPKKGEDILEHIKAGIQFHLKDEETPIRLAITASNDKQYKCELGLLVSENPEEAKAIPSLFEFRVRKVENTDDFNAVFLVPTGIGAEIGGHAGDSTPALRVLAENCDKLITHPNVVNASDINEIPENALYVEGSVITRFMAGVVGLQKVRSNRVLVIIDDHPDEHFSDAAINTVSAARATYGLNCPQVIKLDPSIRMRAEYSPSGRAVGAVDGLDFCLEELEKYKGGFDAIALSSVISVPHEYHLDYFKSEGEMVNPWGGVEAMLTHAISSLLKVPTAHSPMFETREIENLETGLVEPRMSAESVSVSFLQCILKGLHKSPRLVEDQTLFSRPEVLSVEDVSCLIIPDGALGLPTLAALAQGIPVIAVKENRNLMRNDLSKLPWKNGQFYQADNYLEAAGIMSAIKAGVTIESVRRPIAYTDVTTARKSDKKRALKSKK